MRLSLLALPFAVLALAPLTGCSESTPPAKPTDAEIKQLRATAEGGMPSQASNPFPVFQLPTMGYRDWTVKETAVDALARIGASSVPALIDALKDPSPEVRVQAARSLARMGDSGKAAVPVLIERLHDPNEEVRQASARALGQMGPAAAQAVPALIAILKSPDSETAARRKAEAQRPGRP